MTLPLPNLTNDSPPLTGVTEEAGLGWPCYRLWVIEPQVTSWILYLWVVPRSSHLPEPGMKLTLPWIRSSHVHQDTCLNPFNPHLSFPTLYTRSFCWEAKEMKTSCQKRGSFSLTPVPPAGRSAVKPWKQPAIKLKVHKKWKASSAVASYLHCSLLLVYASSLAHHMQDLHKNSLLEEIRGGCLQQQKKMQSASCFQAWKVLLSPAIWMLGLAGKCWM